MAIFSRLFKSSKDEENFYPTGPWLIEIGDVFLCKTRFGKKFTTDPKKINKIKVITNDKGPFSEDLYWKFESTEGNFYLASEVMQAPRIMSELQELNGFDHTQLSNAAYSAEKAVFLVWDRNAL